MVTILSLLTSESSFGTLVKWCTCHLTANAYSSGEKKYSSQLENKKRMVSSGDWSTERYEQDAFIQDNMLARWMNLLGILINLNPSKPFHMHRLMGTFIAIGTTLTCCLTGHVKCEPVKLIQMHPIQQTDISANRQPQVTITLRAQLHSLSHLHNSMVRVRSIHAVRITAKGWGRGQECVQWTIQLLKTVINKNWFCKLIPAHTSGGESRCMLSWMQSMVLQAGGNSALTNSSCKVLVSINTCPELTSPWDSHTDIKLREWVS